MTRLCECGMCGLPVREGRRFVRGHNRKMQPRYTLDRATGCWLWDGRLLESGYGQYKDGGQVWQAHVWFWVQRHGPVPLGRELDHTCRNRRCVNPDHLEPVTHVENVRRGRACKLTIEDVAEIKARYLERARPPLRPFAREMGAIFGVTPENIRLIIWGRQWVDVEPAARRRAAA